MLILVLKILKVLNFFIRYLFCAALKYMMKWSLIILFKKKKNVVVKKNMSIFHILFYNHILHSHFLFISDVAHILSFLILCCQSSQRRLNFLPLSYSQKRYYHQNPKNLSTTAIFGNFTLVLHWHICYYKIAHTLIKTHTRLIRDLRVYLKGVSI